MCRIRSCSRNNTAAIAISTHAFTARKSWKLYWANPSVDFSSLKNNSICQRKEYNSITSRRLRSKALVIRILTSSGVADRKSGFIVEKTICTQPTRRTSRFS